MRKSANKPIGVIGAGSFGTVIANYLAENNKVILYVRRAEQAEEISKSRQSSNQPLHENILISNSIQQVADECEVIFPIIPSSNFREMMSQFGPYLHPYHILIHGTKGFDLNVFFEGVYGNQIFNATNGTHLNSFQRGSNQFRDLIGNYWTAENPDPNAKYPKISAATGVDVSDRFIEMGSYLRLKSVKLAYNLPVKNWGMNWADQAQIYVSGINLLTFTKYTGLDPEVNTKGVDDQNVSNRLEMGHDQSSYPNAKLTSIGLQINF